MPKRHTPPASEDQPVLGRPLHEAEALIDERLAGGDELLAHPIHSGQDLETVRELYHTWTEWNEAWLKRFVGESIAREYSMAGARMVFIGDHLSLGEEVDDLRTDIRAKLRKLRSLRERFPLWAEHSAELATPQSGAHAPSRLAPSGDIFIVHGNDIGAANMVARAVERATGRDVTILHEQPNQGRTLLEKFERHAAAASFAIVLLTPDDVGGKRTASAESHSPRARQNVVFELGFFFGSLGRQNTVVLLDPSVEKPSDVDGLAYVTLDAAGGWKSGLARELSAAGIAADASRMP